MKPRIALHSVYGWWVPNWPRDGGASQAWFRALKWCNDRNARAAA